MHFVKLILLASLAYPATATYGLSYKQLVVVDQDGAYHSGEMCPTPFDRRLNAFLGIGSVIEIVGGFPSVDVGSFNVSLLDIMPGKDHAEQELLTVAFIPGPVGTVNAGKIVLSNHIKTCEAGKGSEQVVLNGIDLTRGDNKHSYMKILVTEKDYVVYVNGHAVGKIARRNDLVLADVISVGGNLYTMSVKIDGRDYCYCVEDECETEEVELVVLVDSSASTGQKNFERKSKPYLLSLLPKFDFSKISVSVVSFASTVKPAVRISSAKEVPKVIDAIPYQQTGTETGDALVVAKKILDASEKKHKIILLLSNGGSRDKKQTSTVAELLKKEGISIIAVAVDKVEENEELEDIAGKKNVHNRKDIQEVCDEIENGQN